MEDTNNKKVVKVITERTALKREIAWIRKHIRRDKQVLALRKVADLLHEELNKLDELVGNPKR